MEAKDYVIDEISQMRQKSNHSLKAYMKSVESLLNKIYSLETEQLMFKRFCKGLWNQNLPLLALTHGGLKPTSLRREVTLNVWTMRAAENVW